MANSPIVNTFKLRNREAQTIIIIVEPWGLELELNPGMEVSVTLVGSEAEMVEIDFTDGRIAFWATAADIRCDDETLFRAGFERHESVS